MTSLVEVKDETRVQPLQKAKVKLWLNSNMIRWCLFCSFVVSVQIEILLGKTANFDDLMVAATERDGEGHQQNWKKFTDFVFDLVENFVISVLCSHFHESAALYFPSKIESTALDVCQLWLE